MKRNQVCSRLSSGLGNQLFQYACGLHLARQNDAQLTVDTTWFTIVAGLHQPVRQLRLHRFGLPMAETFRGPHRWLVGLVAATFDRWGKGRSLLQWSTGSKVVQELGQFRKRPFENPIGGRRLYLNGYWQTADHFLAIRDELVPSLKKASDKSEGAIAWHKKISAQQTSFVHVRRGDYERYMGDNGMLSSNYYRRGAEVLRSAGFADTRWIIFSEDVDWVREKLDFLGNWELVEYKSANRDIEDLQLMAACDAGIVANSSYSWWGAAIGDRPERLIVAPQTYWNTEQSDLSEWVLPGWQRVAGWN